MVEKLKEEIRSRARKATRQAVHSHRFFVIAIPVSTGAFGWFCAYVPNMPIEWSVFGFVVATVIVGVITWFQFATPLVVEQVTELVSLLEELDDLRDAMKFGSTFAVLANVLLKYVETAALSKPFDDNRLQESIVETFTSVVEHSSVLFAFEPGERWSFTLYRSNNIDALEPVKRLAADTHPGRSRTPRTWKFGEGHVGLAFVKQEIVSTSDATDPEIKKLLTVPKGLARHDDDDLYRSYISAPIGDNRDGDKPFGVLVATSDRQGRFGAAAEQPIALVAIVLAMFFRLRYAANSNGGAK